MIRCPLFVLTLILALPCRSTSQGKVVDSLDVVSTRVVVSFFHPYPRLVQEHAAFEQLTPREKSKLWVEFVRRSAIYLFAATDTTTHHNSYYVLRGDPDNTNWSSYYVEVVDGESVTLTDPNTEDYKEHIVARVKCSPAGGEMFLHMFPEEERPAISSVPGYGSQLFPGIYARVASYEKAKTAVAQIITDHLQGN